MDVKSRWEAIYGAKAANAVSWYRSHLDTSLAFIEHAGAGPSAPIIDVGGGESTLVDDLLARGYENLTVLDISTTALEETKKRLGANADRIHWIAGDVTDAELPKHAYDIWHDRAVFHFLTPPTQRAAYVRQAKRALKPGGYLIVATFAADGPSRCSGLKVVRYTAESFAQELGEHFHLVENTEELHHTPSGGVQPFVYTRFQVI